ncbi:MAG: Asp-tRNA(Asn)/Glu-tRNA(Gln) amidotransferase GatCAB subunit B, partial [Kiloniellales bacterium]
GAIEAIVEQVIAASPKQIEQFKSGNEKILGWFVGQVMKASQGKANPGLVNQILRDKLS